MNPSGPAVETLTNETGFLDESPEELLQKVQNGDRDAAFRLGAMYHDGQGVGQDYKKALDLFEQAGRAGDRRSMYNAGMMYLKGEGMETDYVAARRWFTQASDAGNARAPYQLAQLYYQGLGTAQNFTKAREAFDQSARKGMPEAQYNLGIMYIRGEGAAQDAVLGYAWLAVARSYGYAKATDALTKLEEQLTDQMKKDGQTKADALSDGIEAGKAVEQAQGVD